MTAITILETLLEISIYSAVLFSIVMLLRLVLKKHASPALLYLAWFILIARLLMPVTPDSGFSFFVIPSGETAQAQSVDLSELIDDSNNALDPSGQSAMAERPETDIVQTGQPMEANNAYNTSNAANGSSAARTQLLELDWREALVAVWISGAVLTLLFAVITTIRLKRRIKKGGTQVPEKWKQAADRIKAEMGLAGKVSIVMMKGFVSPALNVSFKPVIIMPFEILSQDEEQVEFTLRHELMHLRRRDHIVCLLLMALRIVYWFNPVVWLAAKYMKMDMETACDSMVVKNMGAAEKKQYAGTILRMYTKKQVQYVLGMALGNTKKTAERRLRGVFMRRKSSRKARLVSAALAAVMLVACFTTACQPTPEEPPVIHRSDDIPKEAILETATPPPEVKNATQPAAYSVKEHWKETVKENDFLSIEVDADILMPEAEAYPVERLERVVLTQERVNELIAYFTEPGTKFYTGEYVKLKSEYEEELIDLKQNLQEVLNGGDGETPESIRSYIKEVESKLAQAPETHTYTYVEPVFTYETDYETGEPRKEYGENTISVSIELPDGNRCGSISASRYEKGKNTSTSFSYHGFSGGWNKESYFTWYDEELRREMENRPPGADKDGGLWDKDMARQREFVDAGLENMQKNNMDLRAAADKAIELLEELGIEDMQLKSYEKAMFSREHGQEEDYTIPGCYVEFVRECGGIPSLSQSGGSFPREQDYSELYCAPFGLEGVNLLISEEGVERFSWRRMAQVVERVAENTTLMPIDEMKQSILDYLYFINAAWPDRKPQEAKRIEIGEIRLVTTYINAKDDPERVLIVPAWHIMAQEEYLFDQTDTWTQGNNEEFMINALDGSGILMPGILEHMQNIMQNMQR